MRYAFLLFSVLMGCSLWANAPAASVPKTEEVARAKARPTPLQSSDGALYVSCATADRATLRWPILRFAETVRKHLSETYLPLGSSATPLVIEIGTETNQVTTVERRSFRTGDGFAQLILRIPNPETVDLEILREAVGEALLRERARSQTGRYSSYTWPKWWLRAVLNASKGNVWKAEAYERLQAEIRQNKAPSLQSLLTAEREPSEDAAAFLAMWILGETPYQKQNNRLSLLVNPWTPIFMLGILDEGAWQTWLAEQDKVILLPGVITYSQFLRWQETLDDPVDTADALRLATALSRTMIGRPKTFCDLAERYLSAYSAYVNEGPEAYWTLRRVADTEAKALEQQLQQCKMISIEEGK